MRLSVEDQAFVHAVTALVMSERIWAPDHRPVIVSTVADLLPHITRTEPSLMSLHLACAQLSEAITPTECAAAWHRLGSAVERHHLSRLADALQFLDQGRPHE